MVRCRHPIRHRIIDDDTAQTVLDCIDCARTHTAARRRPCEDQRIDAESSQEGRQGCSEEGGRALLQDAEVVGCGAQARIQFD